MPEYARAKGSPMLLCSAPLKYTQNNGPGLNKSVPVGANLEFRRTRAVQAPVMGAEHVRLQVFEPSHGPIMSLSLGRGHIL